MLQRGTAGWSVPPHNCKCMSTIKIIIINYPCCLVSYTHASAAYSYVGRRFFVVYSI